MRITTFLSPGSLLLVSLALLAAPGCGNQTITCDPQCPTGYHCEEVGCVADNPNVVVDLATPGGDMAMTCPTVCGGATPYCNANRLCVPCLEDKHCPTGQLCKATGNSNICVPGCVDDARCGGGSQKCCNGSCIDTSNNTSNCGGCGMACSGNHARATCQAGACMNGPCDSGWGDCNANAADGCETNLRTDAKNCGACGTTCSFKNAVAACSETCYVAACNFGFDDCDGDEKTGCETSVLSDAKNCGGCGMACPAVPNAKNACSNAACILTSCNLGFSDCDGNPKNGCEVNTGTDVNNCGACGNKCGANQTCINSSCTCINCVIAGAKTKCVNNVCLFDQCLPGFADCDGQNAFGSNGCEVNLTSDPKNCAACGNVCPNNMPACINSACSNADKCSNVAIAYCKSLGWVVAPWATSFPNQPGGSIFCVPPGGSAGNDCDTCKTYNHIVWKASAVDACNSRSTMVPGTIYGGHNPCACNPNNLYNCGQWNMMGCMPD